MEDKQTDQLPETRRPFDRIVHKPLTFGELFAGIGGFSLGLERAGMECRWQVEIDPYCQQVLAKHWPNVRRHDDVRTWPQPDTERVDVIVGGFPCQDISDAGPRIGINGDRSGLWFEFARIISALRPSYVIVENVSALLDRGLGSVLGELAARGFDAEWDCIPAAFVGARHLRARVFVVAAARVLDNADAIAARCFDRQGPTWRRLPDVGVRHRIAGGPWSGEPGVSRVVDGLPHRMDRCERLGNAVCPQVAELIGRRLISVL